MSDEKKYYCFCGSNCRYETMTKEQILAAIAQAVETGSVGDCDTGFITKVKELNGGKYVTFWVGMQSQYNALDKIDESCIYIITDNKENENIRKAYAEAVAAAEEAATRATNAEAAVKAAEANATTSATAAATAAANAAASATAAEEAVQEKKNVDFSADVAHGFAPAGGWNLSTCTTSERVYMYSPLLGIVFFQFKYAYNGTAAENETIVFYHNGDTHTPTIATPVFVGNSEHKMSAIYETDCIEIKMLEAVDTNGVTKYATIKGWYFCNVG